MTTPLPSTVLDWTQLPVKPTPIGARRDLFDAPSATFANFEGHVTTLNPGEMPHPPHQHADEELLVMKTGTLEVLINGQSRRISDGSVCFVASNDLHGWKNVGSGAATYFVFRIVAR